MVWRRLLGIWCLLLYLGPGYQTLSRREECEEGTYILLGSGELDYTFLDRTAAVCQLKSGGHEET